MKTSLLSLACTASLAAFSTAATPPPTLLDYAGARLGPARLSQSVVVVVDAQRDYVEGKLRLHEVEPAVAEIARLLERARKCGTPIVHVVQQGRPGSPVFTPGTPLVESIPTVAPAPGERVIVKTLPNSFAGTELDVELKRLGRKDLVVVGFMTHMCVSATVRSALDHGYRCTVIASACATRDLPGPKGEIVPAEIVHEAELAALGDRFAAVARNVAEVPE